MKARESRNTQRRCLLLAWAAALALTMLPAGGAWPDDKVIAPVGRIGNVDELVTMDKVCGTKPIRVALVDGFGGNSWRRITRAEYEDEARKCPNITEVLYADGQNNPQKTISDIQSLVAQGVEAIVVFPDAGPAMLPAIRAAHKAGTAIVAYTASPGGKPGVDYLGLHRSQHAERRRLLGQMDRQIAKRQGQGRVPGRHAG
jgi:ribose transport system substrate-binding protein